MTIEELAAISQHEIASIRRDMTTKDELRATEAAILRALEGLGAQIARHDSRWECQLDRIDDRLQELEQEAH